MLLLQDLDSDHVLDQASILVVDGVLDSFEHFLGDRLDQEVDPVSATELLPLASWGAGVLGLVLIRVGVSLAVLYDVRQ